MKTKAQSTAWFVAGSGDAGSTTGDLPEAMSEFNRFRLDMAEHDREVDAPALQRRSGSTSVLTAATSSWVPSDSAAVMRVR